MKALSLTQPWASLVACGAKTIETRSWHTRHRGPLAIHATKQRFDLVGTTAAGLAHAVSSANLMDEELPLGAVVAVVELVRVDIASAWLTTVRRTLPGLAEQEERVGDFSFGRFAWTLGMVHRLRAPVPCRGRQGLWTLPADVEALVRAAVPA